MNPRLMIIIIIVVIIDWHWCRSLRVRKTLTDFIFFYSTKNRHKQKQINNSWFFWNFIRFCLFVLFRRQTWCYHQMQISKHANDILNHFYRFKIRNEFFRIFFILATNLKSISFYFFFVRRQRNKKKPQITHIFHNIHSFWQINWFLCVDNAQFFLSRQSKMEKNNRKIGNESPSNIE